ncbi:MAG: hypothetical protein WAX77_02270 [Methylococcaceae bacterium]
MDNNIDTVFREKLENTKRVANQNADMHASEADRYSSWYLSLMCFGLIFTAFLLALSLAPDDFIQRTTGIFSDYYKWLLTILCFLNFSVTLVLLAWRPDYKAAQHEEALSHFSRLRHKIDIVLSDNKILTKEVVEDIINEYIDTEHLPKISDSRFNKLKQKHLIKVAVSKELSENPHRYILWIRIYLWWSNSNWKSLK